MKRVKVAKAFHENVGCLPHKPGKILECTEERAEELINAGFCVAIEEKVEKPKRRTVKK